MPSELERMLCGWVSELAISASAVSLQVGCIAAVSMLVRLLGLPVVDGFEVALE
jgi:hypothetical protein